MHNGDWEFLSQLSKMPPFQFFPIILQTRPDTEVFTQALAHKIFYFLPKPYSQELLLSVLSSALQGLSNFNEISLFISDYKHAINLFKHAIFHARTPQDIKSLAATLSYLTPYQEKTSFGLLELTNNALEHGNLGFGCQTKGEMTRDGVFHTELERHLSIEENLEKYVEISVTSDEECIEFSIRDFGQGFDYQLYLDEPTYQQTLPNGRGILIAKHLSFDSLHYEDSGKVAIARAKISASKR